MLAARSYKHAAAVAAPLDGPEACSHGIFFYKFSSKWSKTEIDRERKITVISVVNWILAAWGMFALSECLLAIRHMIVNMYTNYVLYKPVFGVAR